MPVKTTGNPASYPVYSRYSELLWIVICRFVEQHVQVAPIILEIDWIKHFKVVFLIVHTRPLFANPHIHVYAIVKSLPPVLYEKQRTRHEAEMASIARGKVERYISIETKCWVLYFTYSMWQDNDWSVIKNFLNIHSPPLNIPSLLTLMINYIESGQIWVCSNTLLSYPAL